MYKVPPKHTINKEDTLDLIKQAQLGDELAMHEVALDNFGLIFEYINRNHYKPIGCLTDEDLLQIGYLGLCHAVMKYDESRAAFSTCASKWIGQYLKRYSENTSLMIRVPTHAFYDKNQDDDLLKNYQKICSTHINLESGDYESYALCQDDKNYEVLEYIKLMSLVRSGLGSLDNFQRRIIELNFGLDGVKPISLDKIAKKLGVSYQVVRNNHKAALSRLSKIDDIKAARDLL